MIAPGSRVFAYRFRDENRKATPYWRDVGTLDAYYQANMDLVDVDPVLNLYDAELADPHVPAAAARRRSSCIGDDGPPGHARRGEAHRQHGLPRRASSPAGTSGAASCRRTCASTATPWSRTRSCSTAWTSAGTAGIRRAIIDKDVKLPPYTVLGYDPDADRRRGFTVTEGGVVVVPKAEPPETFVV